MYVFGIQGQLLEITVVGCNKLRNTEWISRQDPYACLDYASSKHRTRTFNGGGKYPTFQGLYMDKVDDGATFRLILMKGNAGEIRLIMHYANAKKLSPSAPLYAATPPHPALYSAPSLISSHPPLPANYPPPVPPPYPQPTYHHHPSPYHPAYQAPPSYSDQQPAYPPAPPSYPQQSAYPPAPPSYPQQPAYPPAPPNPQYYYPQGTYLPHPHPRHHMF